MTFLEKHQCLIRLKTWLRQGRGSSLAELAAALEVSPRTIKRWIVEIRRHDGWDVAYNRRLKQYTVRGVDEAKKK